MTSPLTDDRQARALELHLAGANYDAIAAAVGYANKGGAYKAVQRALTALGKPPGLTEAVDTEMARLDAMLTGLWGKARRGDIQAVDRVLRISERRTQLLAMNYAEQASTEKPEETALDEFTKRLYERESTAKASRRTGRG